MQGDLFVHAAWGAEERLRRFLADESDKRVDLILTRNRVSMVSLRFISSSHVRLRLHEHFLSAPEEVWGALADYIRTQRSCSWKIVSEFAGSIDVSSEETEARKLGLRSGGRVYDLDKIARGVNREFFNGRVKYRIGWGRERPESRGRGRRGKSIRYGSWSRVGGIIRIHPLLDDERVPLKFVEYIVFHEMLHAIVPSEHRGDRRCDHSATFRAFERRFPECDEMLHLAEELLDILC